MQIRNTPQGTSFLRFNYPPLTARRISRWDAPKAFKKTARAKGKMGTLSGHPVGRPVTGPDRTEMAGGCRRKWRWSGGRPRHRSPPTKTPTSGPCQILWLHSTFAERRRFVMISVRLLSARLLHYSVSNAATEIRRSLAKILAKIRM